MNINTMQAHAAITDEMVQVRDKAMPPDANRSLLVRLENIASLSQAIRFFGACAILVSMSLFMLKGWSEGNDIGRYLKLLAQTGLLSGAGLGLTFLIKEFKGARVFFGLALVSVVANFTILGSLSYSLFALDGLVVDYPAMMKWEALTAAKFLPVFVGAVALLSLVSYFGFSVFARQIAKPLTIGFLALSSILLVPVRTPLIETGLAACAFFSAYLLIKRLSNTDKLVFTKEVKACLSLLLLPGIIIVARALSFYHIDEVTLLAVSTLGFIGLRSIEAPMGKLLARIVDAAQLGLGVLVALLLGDILPSSMRSLEAFIPIVLIIGFSFDQVINGREHKWNRILTSITTTLVVPISLLLAISDSSIVYSLEAVAICGLLLGVNIRATKRMQSITVGKTISITGLLAATLLLLIDMVHLMQLGNWIIIGLIGGGLILGASFYERYGLSLSKQ